MSRRLSVVLAGAALFAAAAPAIATPANPPLAAAIADPHRAADRARDIYRHPAETLTFFRVEPGMTVADVSPGGGWYTRVLLPYLGAKGSYIALGVPSEEDASAPDFRQAFAAKARDWAGASTAPVSAYVPGTIPAALLGRVDRVLIMREVHNLVHAGTFADDLETFRQLLKPGGMLCIEEHRAKPDAPASYVDGSKGYMKQADVIRMVEAAGFKLAGTSEINANPKDSADWPAGVWTLPPTYTLKDQDRAKYAAIGESDRMTLLFVKR